VRQGHGDFFRIGARNQLSREVERKDFFSQRTAIFVSQTLVALPIRRKLRSSISKKTRLFNSMSGLHHSVTAWREKRA